MLHAKAIHYPSGYPMPRSPPLFICSSPGPDPYRSHDNVYEELEHNTRDTDSEPPLQSDDEFAEDELSLPGDRSFHKSTSDATTVATIYHDRSASSNGGNNSNNEQYIERNRTERNSLLSSTSSSGNDNNHRPPQTINNRNSNSSADCASSVSGNNNSNSNNNNSTSNNSGIGVFRSRKHQTNINNNNNINNNSNKNFSADDLNLSSEQNNQSGDVVVIPSLYDERGLMTLPPSYSNNNNNNNENNHLNNINNNNRSNYYSTIDGEGGEDEVARRNRINAQLSAAVNGSSNLISRDRHSHRNLFNNNHNHNSSSRSRTNPRSLDRRRYINNSNSNNNNNSNGNSNSNNNNGNLAVIAGPDPNYSIYHEPVFHEGLIYDACLSHTYSDRSSNLPYPYILPHQFTTFRNGQNGGVPVNGHSHHPHPTSNQTIYSRDSSFGSDSGYSQHTQASNRSGWARRPQTTNRHPKTAPEPQNCSNRNNGTYENS